MKALTALKEYAQEKKDAECASSGHSLYKDMTKMPFLVSTIVWYNVLYHINRVSKILQSPNVSIKIVRKEILSVSKYLEDFRENGFNAAKTDAKEIAETLEVEMSWPEERQKTAKRQFVYEGREETLSTPEERFKRNFFLHLVDTAIVTLRERFFHLQGFFDLYGFLYSTESLRNTVQEGKLGECCHRLEEAMGDVDAEDLKMEVMGAFRSFPSQILTPFEM
ncbi:uncharacterized protein LOC136078769 [Hydra vulgaris]|uniref:Uncharacterized protein LOC136078769 n=1 Tax=Hydra vulgaris TaxID=6087 RepID=A0ABM4BNG7_HYDVU